jgi:transcriptional antiterminator RfaH
MPVLPLEPFLFPGDLLSSPAEPACGPARWWVLHTRPRAEKALARNLFRRHISFFLPLYQRPLRTDGRTRIVHLPLFPGYCFLFGDEAARVTALTTNLVVRCLPVNDQGQLHADLSAVHQLVTTGEPLTPLARMRPGTRVEIIAGPLAGLRGKFIRQGKRTTFCVEVQLLQRGVAVEVETWMIQPLDG